MGEVYEVCVDPKADEGVQKSKNVVDVIEVSALWTLFVRTADLLISRLHKRVTTDTEYVQVLSVLVQPLLRDKTAI